MTKSWNGLLFLSIFLISHTVASQTAFAFPLIHLSDVDPHNVYQWDKTSRDNWFEWWYYKVIDPQTQHAYFFCYGVVNPWDTDSQSAASHAFVTFGDFDQHLILRFQTPVSQFNASAQTPFVQVGPQTATDTHLMASFEDQGHTVSWDLTYKKQFGWDAMGWGLLFPHFFNIYWHPAQMDAFVQGSITIDGREVVIKDAPGYQDRNWGHSFPTWWFWIHSNSFIENPQSSFVGGGGHAQDALDTPLPTAVLLALKHNGKLYEFRSSEPKYYFDWTMNLGHWEITAQNFQYKLLVTADALASDMMDLQFATPDGNIFHDYETLNGNLEVTLYQKKNLGLSLEKIVQLTSHSAGLEYGKDHLNP